MGSLSLLHRFQNLVKAQLCSTRKVAEFIKFKEISKRASKDKNTNEKREEIETYHSQHEFRLHWVFFEPLSLSQPSLFHFLLKIGNSRVLSVKILGTIDRITLRIGTFQNSFPAVQSTFHFILPPTSSGQTLCKFAIQGKVSIYQAPVTFQNTFQNNFPINLPFHTFVNFFRSDQL